MTVAVAITTAKVVQRSHYLHRELNSVLSKAFIGLSVGLMLTTANNARFKITSHEKMENQTFDYKAPHACGCFIKTGFGFVWSKPSNA